MCCCVCPPPEPYAVPTVALPAAPIRVRFRSSGDFERLRDATRPLDDTVVTLRPQVQQLQALVSTPPSVAVEPEWSFPTALELLFVFSVLCVVAVAALGIYRATRRTSLVVSPVQQAVQDIDELSSDYLSDVIRVIHRSVTRL